MFRLIGFLVGVVITVVVLAAVVDAPTRKRAVALATDLTTTIFNAVDRLRTKGDVGGDGADVETAAVPTRTHADTHDAASVEETPAFAADEDQSTSTPNNAPAASEATPAPAVGPVAPSAPSQERQKDPLFASSAVSPTSSDSTVAELNWEPVWRAFRSEISAKGFAGHLERLTGQEYRIRRTSPWAYQVELPYSDEAQRNALLHEIQTKTGLKLMEKRP